MVSEEYPAGTSIGPYRVVEVLGTVGLAHRLRVRAADGAEFALGLLDVSHPDLARTLRSLPVVGFRHPSVVPLVDVILVDRRVALVTEPLPGEMLKTRLARGPVDDELALAWTRSLLQAAAAFHELGLTHRDVRPETVLVEGDRLRVLDLGVAAAVFSLASHGRSVTTSGTTIGRPQYWAPERARRPNTADARADLFSIGCVTYELFAGIGPFAGLNLYDCYHATLESRYPPLPERRRGLPTSVGTLVASLLRAKPEHRPASAREALEILDGSRPAPAAPSLSQSPAALVSPPRSPPWWPLVLGGILLAGMLAFLAAAWLR